MGITPAQARANGAKGGRKPGQVSLITRRRANELTKEGETPLDVMVQNMLFWHRSSQQMGEQINQLLQAVDGETPEQLVERTRDATKIMAQFMAAQENAQKCAVDAAPYMHPRLQSIAIKKSVTRTVIKMTMSNHLGQQPEVPKPADVVTIDPGKRTATG